jgi:lipid-binding SYLF domain-containing protein
VNKTSFIYAAIAFSYSLVLPAQEHEQDRLKHAGEVLTEIVNIPDSIPRGLLDRAECVIVFPSVKKLALGVGASYGRGAMSCRSGASFTGPWGPPAMYALEGGNIGFQIGGQATDFVLLVVNPKGVESILKSKVKLGADASAAAGPKGRDAEAATDVLMRSEVLTYSRSRGLFAGVSLEGSTFRSVDSQQTERKLLELAVGNTASRPHLFPRIFETAVVALPPNIRRSDSNTVEDRWLSNRSHPLNLVARVAQ